MRTNNRPNWALLLLALGAFVGCTSETTVIPESGAGGDSGIGGSVNNPALGGASGTVGGASATVAGASATVAGASATVGGAVSSVGGSSNSLGGSATTGGVAATGGVPTTAGGSTSKGGAAWALGGATSAGGATSKGGTTSVGGMTSKGGATSVGGMTSKGGATSAGGMTSKGGATSAGGTTSGTSSTSGYPLGNPAVPSPGCGKALSTFKSGTNTTYKLTSAGLSREYILYIPSNYDPSKPYRLVFSMHCMGSSATNSANNEQYYRLKPLDTAGNTIFVAPQGYTDSMPWRGGDNKDHVFFEDMVKLFTSELCIDNSRIFSVGFSFGAMFTNSLAQTHQDILRGVVVYATADYNIYFPANTGKPIAYMGVHGTADGTCPITSGRNSKDRFVKNNGCKVATAPEATTSTHVTFDHECPANYPVKWATHNGGHTDLPKDPGQSTSWDIDMTWKFITQF